LRPQLGLEDRVGRPWVVEREEVEKVLRVDQRRLQVRERA
jgi:hypothetical protein